MGILLVVIFFFAVILAFLEEYIDKYKVFLYFLLGFILILVAGLREVGIDPDSKNYEYTYQHYYVQNVTDSVEYSYVLVSKLLNYLTDDVHALFLFYALFGVGLKFIAIRKYTELWFLPVVFYISFYFELHELTQIRTGILSGLFLLAIAPIAERKWIPSVALILLAAFFHISALVLLPLLFLTNNEMGHKQRIKWALVIPIGYFLYFFGTSLIINDSIPYIGSKLAIYQKATEKGISDVNVNVFSPRQLLTVALYYYLFFYQDLLQKYNKYYPLMMKISAIGIASYCVFAFLPVLAERLSYLYCTVNIILYANIFYTIKPKWASVVIASLIALLLFNYGLSFIDFPLLFKVGG